MTIVRSLLVLLVIGACLLPAPAAAGGWWNGIDLNSEYLAIGETFEFRQQVAFADSVAAEEALNEDYGAYLMSAVNQRMLDRAMGKGQPWGLVDASRGIHPRRRCEGAWIGFELLLGFCASFDPRDSLGLLLLDALRLRVPHSAG